MGVTPDLLAINLEAMRLASPLTRSNVLLGGIESSFVLLTRMLQFFLTTTWQCASVIINDYVRWPQNRNVSI